MSVGQNQRSLGRKCSAQRALQDCAERSALLKQSGTQSCRKWLKAWPVPVPWRLGWERWSLLCRRGLKVSRGTASGVESPEQLSSLIDFLKLLPSGGEEKKVKKRNPNSTISQSSRSSRSNSNNRAHARFFEFEFWEPSFPQPPSKLGPQLHHHFGHHHHHHHHHEGMKLKLS